MSQQIIEIVEDDPNIRAIYKTKLSLAGYQIVTANDGVAGYYQAEKYKPELILLDIKMPRLPGHEMLKKVRQQEWGEKIKVIVLTNISKSEAPLDFRLLNIDQYIVKVHYTPGQVLDIVKEVLAKS